MQDKVNQIWYGRSVLKWLLWPLTIVFAGVIWLRKQAFRLGLKKSQQLPVPVIVVGNITVGGSGKTPTVIYLIELLRQHGYKPGVISRGYGAKFEGCRVVHPDSRAEDVGDEPAMIAARTKVPMVVGRKRVDAAFTLLAGYDVDVIICDDGLQHYALQRDIELAILDGERLLGNGMLLPAGPLREPKLRLDDVDFVINNGGYAAKGEWQMDLEPAGLHSISANVIWAEKPDPFMKVAAMAGIGNPQRFFDTLHHLKYRVEITKAFDDHQAFKLEELTQFANELPLLMTEKDAVKCREFAKHNWWYLAVNAKLTPEFDQKLLTRLQHVVDEKKG